ncbi:MAG: hypothetical protein AAGA67_14145, partial [Cyanobacteria bacterium P01_F01_bin.153]
MTRDSSEFIRRARQGDVQAIATLLNRSLNQEQIQATTERRGTTLVVLLKGKTTPSTDLVGRLHKGTLRLRPARIAAMEIYGQDAGSIAPAWSRTFDLTAAPSTPSSTENPSSQEDQVSEVSALKSSPQSKPLAVDASMEGSLSQSPEARPKPAISRMSPHSRHKPPKGGLARLAIWVVAVWGGFALLLKAFLAVAPSGAIGEGGLAILLLLVLGVVTFVLLPRAFQESVALLTRQKVWPSYLDALGINTLG